MNCKRWGKEEKKINVLLLREQFTKGSFNRILLETTMVCDKLNHVPIKPRVKCIKWRDLPFLSAFDIIF